MPKATTNYPSGVVNGKRRGNGGWHPKGKRAYRSAERRIIECLQYYQEPRLYHLCFAGGIYEEHKSVLTAVCQQLTRKRLQHEWFAARERSVDKGEHLHVFILVDSYDTRAETVLNTFDDCWLALECAKRGLEKAYINRPQDDELHGGKHCARLPYLGQGNRATEKGLKRLSEALAWLSYIYKTRDKHDEEWKGQGQGQGQGQIFPASRPKRSRQIVIPAEKRQQSDNERTIKVKTGDNLLDQLIAETQHIYRQTILAESKAALH
jgi:hypothetical protein